MKKDPNKIDQGRRQFVRDSAFASAGALMAAATQGTAAPSSPIEEELSTEKEGYRLSQHVVDYYRTVAR